jgi:hypothetical protein
MRGSAFATPSELSMASAPLRRDRLRSEICIQMSDSVEVHLGDQLRDDVIGRCESISYKRNASMTAASAAGCCFRLG